MFEDANLFRRLAGRIQRRHRILKADAEPSVKSFAEAVDLAVAGCRRQWHGIEVIQNDTLARSASIGALVVSFQACANDLAQFLEWRVGPPMRRVTKFFQLHREGAAPLYGHGQVQFGGYVHHACLDGAIPFNYRVLPGRCRVIEISIFKKQ